jgi:hypothetical protein
VPDDQLRPEVVAALSEPVHLPTDLVDQVLDATDAERAAAAAELADRTRQFLAQIGALKPSASVLDLDYRRLGALTAVWATIERWWKFPPYQGTASERCSRSSRRPCPLGPDNPCVG